MKLKQKIRNRYRIELMAADKGVKLTTVQKQLGMSRYLFSYAKSGERKKAHQRLVNHLKGL